MKLIQKEDVCHRVLTAVRIVRHLPPDSGLLPLGTSFKSLGFDADDVKQVGGLLEADYVSQRLDMGPLYRSRKSIPRMTLNGMANYVYAKLTRSLREEQQSYL